jgi:tetratricopeptide (TPR) repeat protein
MDTKLKSALSEIKNGKLNKALQILNGIISSDVNNFAVYLHRGKVKRELADFQGALEDYDTAVTLLPDRAEVYNNRAKLYYLMGYFEKALKDIKKAGDLSPECSLILFNKGNIESKLNLFKDAQESYSKAIKAEPLFLFAYLKRGALKEKCGDYSGALKDYSNAIELNRKCTKAYYYRDTLLTNIKKTELKGKMELLTYHKRGIDLSEKQFGETGDINANYISRTGKSEKVRKLEKMQFVK